MEFCENRMLEWLNYKFLSTKQIYYYDGVPHIHCQTSTSVLKPIISAGSSNQLTHSIGGL